MDFGSPDVWQWIWLATAIVAAIGEIAIAGSFFLFPFAVGAAVAAVVAFAGGPLALGWLAFLSVSAGSLAVMRPLARRLDARTPNAHIGAGRWAGMQATVITDIGPGAGAIGSIRLDREEWRAESLTGELIKTGSVVLVSRVEGTRCIVMCIEEPPAAGEVGPAPEVGT